MFKLKEVKTKRTKKKFLDGSTMYDPEGQYYVIVEKKLFSTRYIMFDPARKSDVENLSKGSYTCDPIKVIKCKSVSSATQFTEWVRANKLVTMMNNNPRGFFYLEGGNK